MNLKSAPPLPPFPGLTWLQTPLTPPRSAGGRGAVVWYVQSVHSVFSLTFFPSHSFPLLPCGVFMGHSSFGNIRLLSTNAPQGAVDTCSTMEHLLFLLTLVSPVLFPPLFLSLYSLLLFPASIFSPFLNGFTEVPPGWPAQLCPVAGSLEPAMSGMGNPWPLLTEATTAAPLLPKPCHLHSVQL